jgi:LmbE family N-acetylglucosaminyl deacetylase
LQGDGHAFPPIRSRDELPRRVLVVVAHADDEVIGIGGLLAFHAQRGDSVHVVHATTGGRGDPDARHEDIEAMRQQEGVDALAALGIDPPTTLGFQDGSLSGCERELATALGELFAEHTPGLLYTFHRGEYHADHRAIAAAACKARDFLEAACRILLFGVNQAVPFGDLYDYSDLVAVKQRALACFRSQLAYLDFATKVMQRDQAATVNVELPEVTHAELLAEVDRETWPAHIGKLDAFVT